MKKRLEAELISIAHRILKLKSKSELDQLYLESRTLYETLSVLKFVEDNVHAIQPKVDSGDIEKMIQHAATTNEQAPVIDEVPAIEIQSENSLDLKPNVPIADTEHTENVTVDENIIAVENDVTNFSETSAEDQQVVSTPPVEPEKTTLFFDSGFDYSAEFVKKETTDIDKLSFEKKSDLTFDKAESPRNQPPTFEELYGKSVDEDPFIKKPEGTQQTTLNQILGKNTTFGLNDKIGFIKNLFDGSEEDFNRVVSQIGTFDTANEVQTFIKNLVKPDYNNWENKEDYENRFMEIALNKFS